MRPSRGATAPPLGSSSSTARRRSGMPCALLSSGPGTTRSRGRRRGRGARRRGRPARRARRSSTPRCAAPRPGARSCRALQDDTGTGPARDRDRAHGRRGGRAVRPSRTGADDHVSMPGRRRPTSSCASAPASRARRRRTSLEQAALRRIAVAVAREASPERCLRPGRARAGPRPPGRRRRRGALRRRRGRLRRALVGAARFLAAARADRAPDRALSRRRLPPPGAPSRADDFRAFAGAVPWVLDPRCLPRAASPRRCACATASGEPSWSPPSRPSRCRGPPRSAWRASPTSCRWPSATPRRAPSCPGARRPTRSRASSTAASSRSASPRRSAARGATAATSPSRCSTSTVQGRSTTSTATWSATRCSARRPCAWRPGRGRAT